MTKWKQYCVPLLGLVLLGSFWGLPVDAKPQHGKGKPTERVNSNRNGGTTTPAQSLPVFTGTQRTQLSQLLNGTTVRNNILDTQTRSTIAGQVSSLPPGIQKRLARGKALPPGIAKKVFLPKTVNSYLNVSTQYDLIVMGSNVVMYDSVTQVVADVISRAF
ncbi:MAG: anti-virulence regulator CigR family protein [Leptolyngbyaceae cyanobacterium bins.59]|nr:anti-virulence regulator CigR family protein [Leptolyngbyaceae cyanobacterium bins.59]